MTAPANVEIRCVKNKDGTYDAVVFCNGEQLADFPLVIGKCEAMRDLRKRVRAYFPRDVEIDVDGPCSECFSDDRQA